MPCPWHPYGPLTGAGIYMDGQDRQDGGMGGEGAGPPVGPPLRRGDGRSVLRPYGVVRIYRPLLAGRGWARYTRYVGPRWRNRQTR